MNQLEPAFWSSPEMSALLGKIEDAIQSKQLITLTPEENNLYKMGISYVKQKMNSSIGTRDEDYWREVLDSYYDDYKAATGYSFPMMGGRKRKSKMLKKSRKVRKIRKAMKTRRMGRMGPM